MWCRGGIFHKNGIYPQNCSPGRSWFWESPCAQELEGVRGPVDIEKQQKTNAFEQWMRENKVLWKSFFENVGCVNTNLLNVETGSAREITRKLLLGEVRRNSRIQSRRFRIKFLNPRSSTFTSGPEIRTSLRFASLRYERPDLRSLVNSWQWIRVFCKNQALCF